MAGRRLRPGGSALTLLLVLAVAVTGCGSGNDEPRPVRTTDPVSAFAPLVHLHGREDSYPLSTEVVLAHSTLEWMSDDCGEINIAAGPGSRRRTGFSRPLEPRRLGHAPAYAIRPPGDGCRGHRPAVRTTDHSRPYDRGRGLAEVGAAEGLYLDILIADHTGRRWERHYGGQRQLVGTPAYFQRRVVRVGGRRALRLTYWMLFPDSEVRDGAGESLALREGDWERLDVDLRRAGPSWVPLAVRFHRDRAVERLPWNAVELAAARNGGPATHPVVYLALESHTPYPVAGRHERSVIAGLDGRVATAVEHTERCADCPIWRTWLALQPVESESWYGFGGGWGTPRTRDSDSGPLGPSPFIE